MHILVLILIFITSLWIVHDCYSHEKGKETEDGGFGVVYLR